jgi:hypothetical protein
MPIGQWKGTATGNDLPQSVVFVVLIPTDCVFCLCSGAKLDFSWYVCGGMQYVVFWSICLTLFLRHDVDVVLAKSGIRHEEL